jgi:uncharacterized surface protein with fasciclin (FAS1) repeats
MMRAAAADRSLAMFMTAVQSSGMAKMMRDQGPLTVFAVSNRAFSDLSKEDRDAPLAKPAAMNFLLAHYIARGIIASDDRADLLPARTVMGAKLRIDVRGEDFYVNGSRLGRVGVRCTNGMIYVLDSFDPGLIHDALAISRADSREK